MALAPAIRHEAVTLGACHTCGTIKVLSENGPRLTETCRACGDERRDFDQVVYDPEANRLTRLYR